MKLQERLRAGRVWCAYPSAMGESYQNDAPIEAAAQLDLYEAALRLWLAYDDQDEADFAQAGPMLLYARAIDATRTALNSTDTGA